MKMKKSTVLIISLLSLFVVAFMLFAFPWLHHLGRENESIRYALHTPSGTLVYFGTGELKAGDANPSLHSYTRFFPETYDWYMETTNHGGTTCVWTKASADLYRLRDKVRTVVVKEGITYINLALAPMCSQAQTLYLPASLTKFDYYLLHQMSVKTIYFSGDAPALGEQTERGILQALQSMGDDLTIVHKPGAKGFDAEPWQQFHVVEQDFRAP